MENIMSYISEEKFILIPVLYVLGMLLKNSVIFKDKYIPLTLMVLGVVSSIFLGDLTYNGIVISIMQGVLITGVAVLGNQLLKQMQKDFPFLSIAETGNSDQKGDGNNFSTQTGSNTNNNEEGQIDDINSEGGMNVPVKIYLDAGHGGNDPGAVYGEYKEKDFNLEAVLYIGKRLTELGAEVEYSRTTDINPGEVFSRGTKSNGYNYFLSIHCNAGGGSGAEIIVNCKETGAQVQSNYKRELSKLGNFRKVYSRKYSNGTIIERPIVNEKFTSTVNDLDWYGVLRGCWSVGVTGDLLEMFFLDNPSDINNYILNKKSYWEAITKSICLTYGMEYTEPIINNDEDDMEELQQEIEDLKQIILEKEAQIRVLETELSLYVPKTFYEKQDQ